jgi:hypothetical protein
MSLEDDDDLARGSDLGRRSGTESADREEETKNQGAQVEEPWRVHIVWCADRTSKVDRLYAGICHARNPRGRTRGEGQAALPPDD